MEYLSFLFKNEGAGFKCLEVWRDLCFATDLQSDTDDIKGIFNLWMLSSMSQLFAQPDAETTQRHTPKKG